MKPIRIFHAACIASVFICADAHAGMGPCVPDEHQGLVCGSGDGAARVIEETLSPSKRFALAWRTPDGTPDDQPDSDKIELVRALDVARESRNAPEELIDPLSHGSKIPSRSAR
jgi:hypothetical protein